MSQHLFKINEMSLHLFKIREASQPQWNDKQSESQNPQFICFGIYLMPLAQ